MFELHIDLYLKLVHVASSVLDYSFFHTMIETLCHEIIYEQNITL